MSVSCQTIRIDVYHQGEVHPENQLTLGNELKFLLVHQPPVGLGLPDSDVSIEFHDGSRPAYTVRVVLPEELIRLIPTDMDADGILCRSLANRFGRDDFIVRVQAPGPGDTEEEL